MKYCLNKDDVPTGEHWVIVEFVNVNIPAEGHGYPAHIEKYSHYISYLDKSLWESAIIAKTRRNERNFIAFYMPSLAKISTEVKIKIVNGG